MTAKEQKHFSCIDCAVINCKDGQGLYPDFCVNQKLSKQQIDEVADLYINDAQIHKIAVASAEVEGAYYGLMTRVEEIMEFARRIGAKKIGIAVCVGLINEGRIFARILRRRGFAVYGVCCKIGGLEKG
ncbi:MAG: DUF1847 domain-containing protein [Bacillota bacterium]|jgi:uncharacterized metal-binding protein